MFRATKSNVSIAYIHIGFNISGIRDWLKNPCEIGTDKKWSLDSDQITHSIDLLVEDELYFHRGANQFSHLIAGSQHIDKEIGAIGWQIIDGNFFIALEYEGTILGMFPLNEVRELLQTGRTKTDNPINGMKVGEVVDLSEPDMYCKKYLKKTWLSFALILSNDLTSFTFSIPSSSQVVEYPVDDQ